MVVFTRLYLTIYSFIYSREHLAAFRINSLCVFVIVKYIYTYLFKAKYWRYIPKSIFYSRKQNTVFTEFMNEFSTI